MAKPQKSRPEREETDQSLRLERQKTNDELARARGAIEDDNDALVQVARKRADQVLDTARELADERIDQVGTVAPNTAGVERERALEDAALQLERDTADDTVLEEREHRKLLFASLLRVERGQSDQRLLVERARADQALTAREDFMGMVSHDLRTLLGGIAMSAAILAKTASHDERGAVVAKNAERIQGFTVRVNRLVGDLLDVASIEAGKLTVAPDKADVGKLLRQAVEAFHLLASEKGVTLDSELVKSPLHATFDHDRILQVLANLISNAVKFTPQGGRILIRVVAQGGEVCFSVQDTGAGIRRDQLESVFDRFWQVSKGDRRGLGLGLFISKCIVDAHGGKIWAESTHGKGSTFFFTLPARAS